MAVELRTVNVETSLGVIPVTGTFGDRKLAALAITGAFADADQMARHPETVAPEFDGYVAHLPGWITPPLSETSIPAFARAFDEVLQTLGPTVVVGVSAGALVALAMRSPLLRGVVAVEPPLSTAKLWPVLPLFRQMLGGPQDAFVRNVFGITETSVEERGYGSLLEGLTAPLETIVGSEPLLPPRPVERPPSVVDRPERELLAKHGKLSVVVPAGHTVQTQAGKAMLGVVLRACRRAAAEEAN
jgi:pimeloyl-ACP methyl ester carboxylesterase